MEKEQNECIQCGTCCTSGGPALHSEDGDLVRSGKIPLAQLITIRKGELAHNPILDRLQPVKRELVKISGVGREWNCFYFDPEEKGCTIYDHRPKACRALECWDTAAIEDLIEKDTLSRLELLDEDNRVRPFITEHENNFPCPDMQRILVDGALTDDGELEQLVNREIGYRTKVVGNFELSLGEELFYFGRPLFHLLVAAGARVYEVERRLVIDWPKREEQKQERPTPG
jgi:Fe-S-cluster containining protein